MAGSTSGPYRDRNAGIGGRVQPGYVGARVRGTRRSRPAVTTISGWARLPIATGLASSGQEESPSWHAGTPAEIRVICVPVGGACWVLIVHGTGGRRGGLRQRRGEPAGQPAGEGRGLLRYCGRPAPGGRADRAQHRDRDDRPPA